MEQAQNASAHPHKGPNYLAVGGVLLALTAIEILITLFVHDFDIRIPLFILMLAKVTLVAMFYMHLRSDSKWYTAFFLAPIPFILLLIGAMMLRTIPQLPK